MTKKPKFGVITGGFQKNTHANLPYISFETPDKKILTLSKEAIGKILPRIMAVSRDTCMDFILSVIDGPPPDTDAGQKLGKDIGYQRGNYTYDEVVRNIVKIIYVPHFDGVLAGGTSFDPARITDKLDPSEWAEMQRRYARRVGLEKMTNDALKPPKP